MMGPRQRPRDSVSSTLCCCVFLNYHPFKGITSAPKVLCKNALLFFSPLWQTGAIHQVSEAWIHSSAAKAPGVFSHSVLTKLLTCCWRRCSPNHGPNNPEKVREPITGWGVRGCLWSWITLSIPTGTPGDAPKQFPPHRHPPDWNLTVWAPVRGKIPSVVGYFTFNLSFPSVLHLSWI